MSGMEIRNTPSVDQWPEMELPQRHMQDDLPSLASMRYPTQVLEALEGVKYIANQFREGDEEKAVSTIYLKICVLLLAFSEA